MRGEPMHTIGLLFATALVGLYMAVLWTMHRK